jgi:hypothetical protein
VAVEDPGDNAMTVDRKDVVAVILAFAAIASALF